MVKNRYMVDFSLQIESSKSIAVRLDFAPIFDNSSLYFLVIFAYDRKKPIFSVYFGSVLGFSHNLTF